jgi:hypothetical protein
MSYFASSLFLHISFKNTIQKAVDNWPSLLKTKSITLLKLTLVLLEASFVAIQIGSQYYQLNPNVLKFKSLVDMDIPNFPKDPWLLHQYLHPDHLYYI